MNIYLDNASTTPLLPEVLEVMTEVMRTNFGNPSSIHVHGRTSKSLIESARKTVAGILNSSIGEIFFTSCATEANNAIIKMAHASRNIETIIYSPIEHHCVLHTIQDLEQKGVNAVPVNIDATGEVDYGHLDELLKLYEDTSTLVSIMHANNEIGTINDIKRIGDLCLHTGALFHSDTVQTIGKYAIDLQDINLHFASASAHKFFGPKGIGFMYISSEKMLPPYIHGGAQERNMRAGTENLYGIVGLAKALEMAWNEKETRKEYISSLKSYFKELLELELEDIQFNGSPEGLYNVLSVSFPSSPKADMLMFNLDIAGISASSASACSSGIEEDSHVLSAIGHDSNRKTVRFSFSHLNTKAEIETTIEKLKSMTPVKKVTNA